MYENSTYDVIMKRMLARVSAQVDKREGSIIWDALAPAALEIQMMYFACELILQETFGDTASREYLIKRAIERGIKPYPATHALLQGEFNMDIPIGTRFSLNELNYSAKERMSSGVFKMECESLGAQGNKYFGNLIPIEYVDGLQVAKLTSLLIPGEDEEDTETLRARYLRSFSAQAFGGNVADYTEKVNALDGVGGVKVYRAWNGDIRPSRFLPPTTFPAWFTANKDALPAGMQAWLQAVSTAATDGLLTVGGTVRLVLIDSTFSKPSDELVAAVQTMLDPAENHGEGVGIAPIGHYVTVRGVEQTVVNIAAKIAYQDGWNWESIKTYAEAIIDTYLKDLAQAWASQSEPLIVRISGIESRLLTCPGVLDITDTRINDIQQNLVLPDDRIPIRGSIGE